MKLPIICLILVSRCGICLSLEFEYFKNHDRNPTIAQDFLLSAIDVLTSHNLRIQKSNFLDSHSGFSGVRNYKPSSNETVLEPSPDIYERCFAFLRQYGNEAADFIQCSIEFARPFRFCEVCVISYTKAMTAFNDIRRNDATKGGCRATLLDADRVQILNQIQENLMDIWDSAYCDNCFASQATEDNNGTVHFQYRNEVEEFVSQYANFSTCILNGTFHNDTLQTGNTSVCDDCRDLYRTLNDHYKHMMDITDHKVCMDVVDMMNYTRLMWGDNLHCSKHHRDDPFIILITLILALMPVVFYLSARYFDGRKETELLRQKRMTLGESTSNNSYHSKFYNSGSYQSVGNRVYQDS